MFKSLDLSTMNETDVREAIIRPLLTSLGYRHGSPANIRTEQTLRYDKAFLGRKSPNEDPKLQGRADYVCEVIPYGRWIVEAKSPAANLSLEDAQQAHTYAAHPEIAAKFLSHNQRPRISALSNGRSISAAHVMVTRGNAGQVLCNPKYCRTRSDKEGWSDRDRPRQTTRRRNWIHSEHHWRIARLRRTFIQ